MTNSNTQLSEVTLLPCPFCSATWAKVFGPTTTPVSAGWMVHCQGCGVETAHWKRREQAVQHWNSRASVAAQEPNYDQLVSNVLFEVEHNGYDTAARTLRKAFTAAASVVPQGDTAKCPACDKADCFDHALRNAAASVSTPVSTGEQFKPMCDDPKCWVCQRMAELHAASTEYGWSKKAAATSTTPDGEQDEPRCANCKHEVLKYFDGERLQCALMVIDGTPPQARICGCKCRVEVYAATPPRAVTEPWYDEGDHAWEIRQNVTCVECPHCAFVFAAVHTDGDSDGYSCPNCEGCPEAPPSTTEAILKAAPALPSPAEPRPRIICLCGSTRFIEQFAIKTWELERQGFIVLGCTLLPMWYCTVPSHFGEATGTKEQCDELHLRKIDLADEVLVLNIDGYIGESTAREIAYAESKGKPVRYLEAAALRTSVEGESE